MTFNIDLGPLKVKHFWEIPDIYLHFGDSVGFTEELIILNNDLESVGYLRLMVERKSEGHSVVVYGETCEENALTQDVVMFAQPEKEEEEGDPGATSLVNSAPSPGDLSQDLLLKDKAFSVSMKVLAGSRTSFAPEDAPPDTTEDEDSEDFVPQTFRSLRKDSLTTSKLSRHSSLETRRSPRAKRTSSLKMKSETSRRLLGKIPKSPSLDTFNGLKTTISLSGVIIENYDTLMERRYEKEVSSKKVENVFRLVKVSNGHMFSHTTLTNKEQEIKNYSPDIMKNVITEAANILLLRKTAMSDFVGSFKGKCFHITGLLCDSIYDVSYRKVTGIKKQKVTVVKIVRTVTLPNGEESKIFSILTKKGQIVKMWWSDSTYKMITNPKYFLNEAAFCDRPLPIEDYIEKQDIRNFFLQDVYENLVMYKDYLASYPQIMQLIHKFLRQLLLEKPPDIIPFALKFFSEKAREVENEK